MNEYYEETTMEQVEEALVGLLSGEVDLDETPLAEARITTYEEGGYLTMDRGMVVTLPNGTQFQLTIVER